jgi:glyoxylate reductase
MNNIKVLVSRKFPELGTELLTKAGFSITTWDEDRPMTKDKLIKKAKNHNVLFCSSTEKIDKKFLNASSHLDIISLYAAGYDNIDISEATKLGIPIGFAPGAMNNATADIAFGLMIATSRKMFYLHKSIINGEWNYFNPKANLGMELKNKTLGVYGLGRIGMEMAKLCRGAYDMKILYHNRKPNPEAEQRLNAKFVDFETLLSQSDVISVHCSLSDETKEVFNKSAFSQMKPTSIFINTSRGLVHHEMDLIDALETGVIWGAGLDVTNPEPMDKNNPLLQMENVCVLPHIGSATIEARDEMARLAATNIIEFYKNKSAPHVVNPEVLNNKQN